MDYAVFPFGQVERGSRVVIYGAGRAGQNFFHQVRCLKYCEVLYMVDQNYEDIKVHGTEVRSIDALKDTTGYDCCIISILDSKIKEKVFGLLISLGIPEEKIIKPVDNEFSWYWYGFTSAEKEYEYARTFEGYFRECDAREFVTSKRIDIAVRYLLFKDFINNYENPAHLSLYSRFILARTGGKELVDFHSTGGKSRIDDYINAGKELCASISKNGFLPEHYIPVNESDEALSGYHRIAAALVTDEQIMVKEYVANKPLEVDFSFFEKAAFTVDDKIRILRAFIDIYPGDCTVAVLFAPIRDMWEFVERRLSEHFTIVGSVDLDFNNNYLAFDNVIHETYSDGTFWNSWIGRKSAVLKSAPLVMRAMLLSDEGFKDSETPFYERLKSVKLGIRDSLAFDIDQVPIAIHIPDTIEETVQQKHIMLSVNNLNKMRMKFTQRYTIQFIDKLNEFKTWCFENRIPIADTCIVSSGSMSVFGIREPNDIDFTLMPEHRVKFTGDESYKVSENLEIVWRDYVRSKDGTVISDQILITDDNLYFWFFGCKFVNPELVLLKKEYSVAYHYRDKDAEDLRALELFFDLQTVYDEKTTLRRLVEDEMYRRGIYQ